MLRRFAKAMGVSIHDLIDEEGTQHGRKPRTKGSPDKKAQAGREEGGTNPKT
jgi:hypothetical protein